MSALPRTIRLNMAARIWLDILSEDAIAADADAGFDGGEFSGPAHGRKVMRDLRDLAARVHIRGDEIDHRRSWIEWEAMSDDPLGDWHGRNE